MQKKIFDKLEKNIGVAKNKINKLKDLGVATLKKKQQQINKKKMTEFVKNIEEQNLIIEEADVSSRGGGGSNKESAKTAGEPQKAQKRPNVCGGKY